MSLPREIASTTRFPWRIILSALSFFSFQRRPRPGYNSPRCRHRPAFLNYAVSLPRFLGDGKLIMSLHII